MWRCWRSFFSILLVCRKWQGEYAAKYRIEYQAYSIRKSGAVDNDYTFLVQNTDSKAHSFTFEILGDDGLQIISPREPVVVKGNKRNFLVTIRAQNPLDLH